MRTVLLAWALLVLAGCSRSPTPQRKPFRQDKNESAKEGQPSPQPQPPAAQSDPTHVVVRNVNIFTGTPVHLKIRWLHGKMYRTMPDRPPSFDEPKSFRFEIEEGIMSVGLNDLSDFLNLGPLKDSPLKKAKLAPSNGKLKLTGNLKKLVPIPVQLLASLQVAPDHRHLRMHVEKISALKVPMKGLLGALHLKIDDLFNPKATPGLDVNGDNIDIDVNKLLPPPTAEGDLTRVEVRANGDLMEYYGKARERNIAGAAGKNFMRMRGGVLNFGKLTMHNADLLLVDASPSDWLDFDLNHYQDQLVNGTTRITPEAGLEIVIPDATRLSRAVRKNSVHEQWMKSRNADPPADVY